MKVSKIQAALQSLVDACQAARDLARYERLPSHGTLVVEKYAAAGVHPIRLPIIHRDPMAVNFRYTIWRARVERCRLALRRFLDLAEHFRSGGLVKAGLVLQVQDTNRFEYTERTDGIRVCGVLG